MPNEIKPEPCPKCGVIPRLSLTRQGRGRNSHAVYGYICSNGNCPASYACTVYATQEEALRRWNESVEWKKRIKEWSERLGPCSCGGEAELVYESYDGRGFWFVRCKQCGKGLSALDSMDAIVEAWNRRTKDAE